MTKINKIDLENISLIKKSKLQCNKTLISIFVNKPQFNKSNDFKSYPRNINYDIKLIKKSKVDYLYLPKSSEIYPNGPNKNIKINSFHKKLCGKFRPNHFHAVVDVVSRFIDIINPRKIYLGFIISKKLNGYFFNFIRIILTFIISYLICCKPKIFIGIYIY